MPNSCGNAVERLRLGSGQLALFYTLPVLSVAGVCVQLATFPRFCTQIVLGLTHRQLDQFTPVATRLVPTFHKTYKDNNKVYK